MSRIVYKGRSYGSIHEMPPDVRQAYDKEHGKQGKSAAAKSLTDLVTMSPEIREIYERAMGNVEQKTASSQPLEDLPRTEDIFRQAAPGSMRDQPSDEILYQPSRPVVEPMPPNIEPEEGIGMRGLVVGVVVALVITGLAYLASQFLLL